MIIALILKIQKHNFKEIKHKAYNKQEDFPINHI